MLIFKTKDPKMQSPIKSCIFSLTEASSQFVTNIESLLEENTMLLQSVMQCCTGLVGAQYLSLVRNYCFELEILREMWIAKERLGKCGGCCSTAFRTTSCLKSPVGCPDYHHTAMLKVNTQEVVRFSGIKTSEAITQQRKFSKSETSFTSLVKRPELSP